MIRRPWVLKYTSRILRKWEAFRKYIHFFRNHQFISNGKSSTASMAIISLSRKRKNTNFGIRTCKQWLRCEEFRGALPRRWLAFSRQWSWQVSFLCAYINCWYTAIAVLCWLNCYQPVIRFISSTCFHHQLSPVATLRVLVIECEGSTWSVYIIICHHSSIG